MSQKEIFKKELSGLSSEKLLALHELDNQFHEFLNLHQFDSMNLKIESFLNWLKSNIGFKACFCSIFSLNFSTKSFETRYLHSDGDQVVMGFKPESFFETETSQKELAHEYIVFEMPEFNGKALGKLIAIFSDSQAERLYATLAFKKIAILMGRELVHASYGVFLQNLSLELDECLDQHSINRSLKKSIQVFNKYFSSARLILLTIDNSSGEGFDFNLFILENGKVVLNHPKYHDVGLSLLNGERDLTGNSTIKSFFKGQFIYEKLYKKLLKHSKYIGVVAGAIGSANPEPGIQNVNFYHRNLLSLFASKLEAKLVNYQTFRESLDRMLDPKIANIILENPNRGKAMLKTENREVSIIYADIVGFSRICQICTKAVVLDLVNQFIGDCKNIFFKYGALFDKTVGDCVIGMIGPPFYRESSFEKVKNAIMIGLEIIEVCSKVSVKLEKADPVFGDQFSMGVSIGVNIGNALVGEIGPAGTVDFTAIGHEMNFAARIQDSALKNEILVSENVYRLYCYNEADCKDFSIKPAGRYSIKNMPDTDLYRVLKAEN